MKDQVRHLGSLLGRFVRCGNPTDSGFAGLCKIDGSLDLCRPFFLPTAVVVLRSEVCVFVWSVSKSYLGNNSGARRSAAKQLRTGNSRLFLWPWAALSGVILAARCGCAAE